MKLCNKLAIFHLRCSQKVLSQSLNNKLDASKRGNSSLVLAAAQFLSQIFLKVKADLFFLPE